MSTVAYKPGKKKAWIKARPTGGAAFTLSFDRIANLLFVGGTLREGEEIERFEVNEHGLTVFVTGGPFNSEYRYLPFEEEA